MNKLEKRPAEILLATVNEYIKEGFPVSSQMLHENYDFRIGPASIRAELNDLEQRGWLSQPYTSGGRIPTNRAFEYFAETIKNNINENQKPEKNFSELANLIIQKDFKDFVSQFADEVHLLSVSFDQDEREAYKSGLDELFEEIDDAAPKVFYEIARDIELLDQRMAEVLNNWDFDMESGPQVFIGKKSPLIRNDLVTTVFDIFNIDDSKLFFAAFGPKRMDYKKSFNAFIKIRKAIEEI